MSIKEWADRLNGRGYGVELSYKEEHELERQGFVVVFGASDDLCELRGAITDEQDCYDGGDYFLNRDGFVYSDGYDECHNCKHFKAAAREAKALKIKWSNKSPQWSYEIDVPHEGFTIYEDDKPYCRGIIFDINDLA